MIIIGYNTNMISMILDNIQDEEAKTVRVLDNHGNYDSELQNEIFHPSIQIKIIKNLPKDESFKLFCAVYKVESKRITIQHYLQYYEHFVNIIHPNVHVSKSTKLGRGILLNVNTCIAGNCDIGDFVSINRAVSIGHHTTIGRYSTVNPGVTICGRIQIEEGVTIGASATILDGIKIGKNSVVAAGAVVIEDVPENTLVMGVPAKIRKTLT